MSLPDWNDLINKDPAVDYVWAWKGHRETGVGRYMSLGYTRVPYTEEGVRPAGMVDGAPKDLLGQDIENHDHVLMAAPKALKESRAYWGDNGKSGQHSANETARRIYGADGNHHLGNLGVGADGSRYINVRNRTQQSFYEG